LLRFYSLIAKPRLSSNVLENVGAIYVVAQVGVCRSSERADGGHVYRFRNAIDSARTMRFRRSDAVALIAAPMVVVAFTVGGVIVPTICLCLAAGVIVLAIARHDELGWESRGAICALVVSAGLLITVVLYRVNLATELKQQVAPLVAAALPPPVSSNCPIPKGDVALYLGNTVSVITVFPHVVFRVHGDDVFVIERDSSGVLVSFQAFDDRGNVVVRLARNQFVAVNPASHVERPSPSNLIVFDDQGTKVLDVQFLNPQAIKITGILRYPGAEPIVISEKYLGIGGAISPPACWNGKEVDFVGR
jgi:hypothetical protein